MCADSLRRDGIYDTSFLSVGCYAFQMQELDIPLTADTSTIAEDNFLVNNFNEES